MKSTAIAIAGAGRMGQAIAATVEQHDDFHLAGIWSRGDDIDELLQAADVVVDFSLPAGTVSVLDAIIRCRKPLVCGVSGLTEEQLARLDVSAETVAVVFDRNMSLGIAVLERSVREAAASLGAAFEIQVSEVHHVDKKDAPSGTALKLGEAIAASRGLTGTAGVTFSVERRGDVAGEHEVNMTTATEKLTFAHSVTTRQVFVEGALRAASWVLDKEPGRYSMQDVLFSHQNW